MKKGADGLSADLHTRGIACAPASHRHARKFKLKNSGGQIKQKERNVFNSCAAVLYFQIFAPNLFLSELFMTSALKLLLTDGGCSSVGRMLGPAPISMKG